MYKLEFEIKGLPKMSNALLRGHWRSKIAYTQRWKYHVRIACLGEEPKAPLARAKLTLTRCSTVEPDFDGLVSGFKPIVDGLVEAKILANDKSGNIGQPVYLWELAKRGKGCVRIKVEEVA